MPGVKVLVWSSFIVLGGDVKVRTGGSKTSLIVIITVAPLLSSPLSASTVRV